MKRFAQIEVGGLDFALGGQLLGSFRLCADLGQRRLRIRFAGEFDLLDVALFRDMIGGLCVCFIGLGDLGLGRR